MKPSMWHALSLIEKRYPEQKLIWSEYFKPRKVMVIDNDRCVKKEVSNQSKELEH